MSAPQRSRLRAVLFAVALFAAYAYFYQAGGWNQNSRFALVRAIVEHGTIEIDEAAVYRGRLVTGDLARHGGHMYSDKAPGLSLAAAPAVAFAQAFMPDPVTPEALAFLSYVATLAVASLPTVLAALLLLGLARSLGSTQGGALFAALVFGLGSPQWCYATLLFGHALASSCLVFAFAASAALSSGSSDPRRDTWLALGTGVAAGWAAITEYPAAIPGVVIVALALANAWPGGPARRIRVSAGAAAGLVACGIILASYNLAAFGAPFALGYENVEGFQGMRRGLFGVTYPRMVVLRELLFGSYRGLLRLAPVLALAPIGYAHLVAPSRARLVGIALVFITLYYVLLNSAYEYWDGGWSYGPRHMSGALPFACLALAPLWSRFGRAGRIMLGALALYGAILSFVAVSTTAQPPEGVRAPVGDLLWPAFARGDLSLNHQAIFEPGTSELRDQATHAWNLGEKLGLKGHASFAPLFLVWAILAVVGWRTVRSPPKPGPDHASRDEKDRRTERAEPTERSAT